MRERPRFRRFRCRFVARLGAYRTIPARAVDPYFPCAPLLARACPRPRRRSWRPRTTSSRPRRIGACWRGSRATSSGWTSPRTRPATSPTSATAGPRTSSRRGARTGRSGGTREPRSTRTSRRTRSRGRIGRRRGEASSPGSSSSRSAADSGIRAHERTLAEPREDRYRLLRATGVNTSPVVGLGHDASGFVPDWLAEIATTRPVVRARRRRRRRPPAVDGRARRGRGARRGDPPGHRWPGRLSRSRSPTAITATRPRCATPRSGAAAPRSRTSPAWAEILMLILEPVEGRADGPAHASRPARARRGGARQPPRAAPRAVRRHARRPRGPARGVRRRWRGDRRRGPVRPVGRRRTARCSGRGATSFEPLLPEGGPALRRLDVTLASVAIERLAGIDPGAVAGGRLAFTMDASEAARLGRRGPRPDRVAARGRGPPARTDAGVGDRRGGRGRRRHAAEEHVHLPEGPDRPRHQPAGVAPEVPDGRHRPTPRSRRRPAAPSARTRSSCTSAACTSSRGCPSGGRVASRCCSCTASSAGRGPGSGSSATSPGAAGRATRSTSGTTTGARPRIRPSCRSRRSSTMSARRWSASARTRSPSGTGWAACSRSRRRSATRSRGSSSSPRSCPATSATPRRSHLIREVPELFGPSLLGWATLPEKLQRDHRDLTLADVLRIQHLMGQKPHESGRARRTMLRGVRVDRAQASGRAAPGHRRRAGPRRLAGCERAARRVARRGLRAVRRPLALRPRSSARSGSRRSPIRSGASSRPTGSRSRMPSLS